MKTKSRPDIRARKDQNSSGKPVANRVEFNPLTESAGRITAASQNHFGWRRVELNFVALWRKSSLPLTEW
jgi:hypothetical protein